MLNMLHLITDTGARLLKR